MDPSKNDLDPTSDLVEISDIHKSRRSLELSEGHLIPFLQHDHVGGLPDVIWELDVPLFIWRPLTSRSGLSSLLLHFYKNNDSVDSSQLSFPSSSTFLASHHSRHEIKSSEKLENSTVQSTSKSSKELEAEPHKLHENTSTMVRFTKHGIFLLDDPPDCPLKRTVTTLLRTQIGEETGSVTPLWFEVLCSYLMVSKRVMLTQDGSLTLLPLSPSMNSDLNPADHSQCRALLSQLLPSQYRPSALIDAPLLGYPQELPRHYAYMAMSSSQTLFVGAGYGTPLETPRAHSQEWSDHVQNEQDNVKSLVWMNVACIEHVESRKELWVIMREWRTAIRTKHLTVQKAMLHGRRIAHKHRKSGVTFREITPPDSKQHQVLMISDQ